MHDYNERFDDSNVIVIAKYFVKSYGVRFAVANKGSDQAPVQPS